MMTWGTKELPRGRRSLLLIWRRSALSSNTAVLLLLGLHHVVCAQKEKGVPSFSLFCLLVFERDWFRKGLKDCKGARKRSGASCTSQADDGFPVHRPPTLERHPERRPLYRHKQASTLGGDHLIFSLSVPIAVKSVNGLHTHSG